VKSFPVEKFEERLSGELPQRVIEWAFDTFGDKMAVACSFGGASGAVLLDMAIGVSPSIPIYYLDTGLLFPETYEQVRLVSAHYGFTPIAVHPELSLDKQAAELGENLWEREPNRCCDLRKVAPQRSFLRGFRAWLTGVRRDQSTTRAATPVISWDANFELVKINPLAAWTERDVWKYITDRGVPYNPLLDRGYPSIGCVPCTAAVRTGEDPRSGRWSGHSKDECGLHA